MKATFKNKNIKTVFPSLVMSLMVVLQVSCSDLLLEQPESYYDSAKIFESANKAQLGLNGVYNSLAGIEHYGQWEMAIPTSDDMYFISGTNSDGSRRDISHYQLSTSNAWVTDLWKNKYSGIERANNMLTGLKGMKEYANGDEEIQRIEGEVLFLRALLSFDLIRYWGDVPYKTEQTTFETSYLPRTDKQVVYDQIIADLNKSKTLLKWATAGTNTERATQGAARALLMRVYLHRAGYSLDSKTAQYVIKDETERQQYFQLVLDEYQAFLDNGFHGFCADGYEQLWKNYCENKVDPKESLFEIAFFTPDGGKATAGTWATYIGPIISSSYKSGRANGFFRVIPEWFNYYAAGDLRRDLNMCNFDIDANGNQVPKNNKTYYPGKWRRYWVKDMPKDPNNTDVNYVFLRYSDVLLMAAEAYNERGNSTEAVKLINQVRARANAPVWDENAVGGKYTDLFKAPQVADLAYIDDSDMKGKIRTALYWERGFELCYEGTRKYDLIRWGILADAIQLHKNTRFGAGYAAPKNFQKFKHELLPIPLNEIQINSNLDNKNNPGY
ncbi:MAG: RagB/SusD family nutrient uptake outer membrane protein [Paludibacter sp.]|nr:RagB/SusD family nutrient uptake outer membrane protein [Paludibacter sp.]MDD4427737.1 RagB/SusD family nutrient uptake outer membrane protein [Paludibacter sp.]